MIAQELLVSLPSSHMAAWAFSYKHNRGPMSLWFYLGSWTFHLYCSLLRHRQGFCCQSCLFRKCILVWFSSAFLEQWSTIAFCIFTTLSPRQLTTISVQSRTSRHRLCKAKFMLSQQRSMEGNQTRRDLGSKLLTLFQIQVQEDKKEVENVWGQPRVSSLKLNIEL